MNYASWIFLVQYDDGSYKWPIQINKSKFQMAHQNCENLHL